MEDARKCDNFLQMIKKQKTCISMLIGIGFGVGTRTFFLIHSEIGKIIVEDGVILGYFLYL